MRHPVSNVETGRNYNLIIDLTVSYYAVRSVCNLDGPASQACSMRKPARSAGPFIKQIGVARVCVEGADNLCGELITICSGQRSVSVEFKYSRCIGRCKRG